MNTPVTVTFVPEQVITWMVIGLIAGFLASIFVRGRGLGLLGNIIIGILGAFIGGWIFSAMGIALGGILGAILGATVGAIVLLLIIGLIKRA